MASWSGDIWPAGRKKICAQLIGKAQLVIWKSWSAISRKWATIARPSAPGIWDLDRCQISGNQLFAGKKRCLTCLLNIVHKTLIKRHVWNNSKIHETAFQFWIEVRTCDTNLAYCEGSLNCQSEIGQFLIKEGEKNTFCLLKGYLWPDHLFLTGFRWTEKCLPKLSQQ